MGLVYVKELDANYPIAGDSPTREEYNAIIGEIEKAHYKDTAKRGLVGNITWPADLLQAGIGGLGNYIIGGPGGEELQKDLASTLGAPRKYLENKLDVKYIEPPTDTSRYIGSALNFAAGGLVPGAGLASRAATIPGKVGTFVGDVLASTTQGIASEAGRDIGQEFGGETGGVIGSLAGSLGTGLASGALRTTGQKMATKASDLVKKAKGDEIFNIAKNERIRHGLEQIPDLQQRIEKQISLQSQYPEYQPNIAQATGSPSLIADADLLQSRTPERLNQAMADYNRQQSAIEGIAKTEFPEIPKPTAAIALKAKEIKAKLDKKFIEAENQIKKISGREFEVDSTKLGQSIRNSIQKKHDEIYSTLSSKYNSFDDKYKDIPINLDSVLRTVNKFKRDEKLIFQRPEMPRLFDEIKDLLDQPQKERRIIIPKGRGEIEIAGSQSMGVLTSLDKRLNLEYQNVLKNGTPLEKAFVVELKSKVNGKLNELKQTGMAPMIDEYLGIKQDFARYSKIYRQGAVREILQKDPLKTEYKVSPNYIVPGKLFTKTGNARDVEANLLQFRKAVEVNGRIPKEAMDALRDEIAMIYLKRANASGQLIGKNSAEKFLRDYSSAFKAMPELKAEYENVDALIKASYKSMEKASKKIKAFSTSPIAKILGTDEPMNSVSEVLKSKRMTVAAVNQAIKAKKQDDLANAIARSALDSSNPMEALKDKNISYALSTLSPKKKKTLEDIIEMKTTLERQQPGKPKSYQNLPLDELEKRFGTRAGSIAAQFRNVKTGHIGVQTMLTSLLIKFKELRQKGKMEELLDEAIHNTELSDALNYVKNNNGKIDTKSEAIFSNYIKALAMKEAAYQSQPDKE